MALVTREPKPGGGSDWVDGEVLNAEDLNGDINNIITEVNGNLSAANLAAGAVDTSELAAGAVTNAKVDGSADILPTKIDDTSSTAGEHRTVENPGAYISQTEATNLEEEIRQLRYTIRRLAVGNDVKTGDDAVTVGWYDRPARGRNLLRNSNFATDDDTADPDAAPPGWALVGVPTPIALTTDVGTGDGNVLSITGDAASDTGISQTLSLKDSTRYIVGALVAVTSGDTFTLKTTGALTTQLDIDSTDTSYSIVSGVFLTDAAQTDVVVQFLAQTAGDVVKIRDAFCFECSDNPAMPSAHYVFRISDNGVDDAHVGATWTSILDAPGGSAMSISVNPIAGCQIRASAKIQFGDATAGVTSGLRLQEDGTTVDASYVKVPTGLDDFVLTVGYTNDAPTPGTALTYTVDAVTTGGTLDVGFAGLDGPDPAVSWLEVEVLFP